MKLEDLIITKMLGKGNSSKCFTIQNGDVFKKFNNPLDVIQIEMFKYFSNYENESFLFPFEFVYDDKKFYGYITKRFKGETLEKLFPSCNLENLSTHSIKLENNIDYISEGKIVMHDFHSENIMYDKKLLQVIDPDEYGIRDFYSFKEIKDINFNYYRTMIGKLFLSNIAFSKNTKYIIDRVNEYRVCDIKVSEMILKIKEDIEKYYKEKIDTIEDFNTIIRK